MLTLIPVVFENTVCIMLHHSARTEQVTLRWSACAAPSATVEVRQAGASRCDNRIH